MTYAIGLTADTLVELPRAKDSSNVLLRIPPPFPAQFTPYRIVGQNGAGAPVAVGFPTVTWHWTRLQKKWFDYFTALLGGATSVNLYIRTRDDAGAFQVYSATMWRPTSSPGSGNARLNVDQKFTQLEHNRPYLT
jgi:hypothetical protein